MAKRTHTAEIAFDDRPAREHAGLVLLERRNAHGWMQEEVARKVGRAPSVISGLETGKKWPEMRAFLHIAYVLDTPPAMLFPEPIRSPMQDCITLLQGSSPEMVLAVRELLRVGIMQEIQKGCQPSVTLS